MILQTDGSKGHKQHNQGDDACLEEHSWSWCWVIVTDWENEGDWSGHQPLCSGDDMADSDVTLLTCRVAGWGQCGECGHQQLLPLSLTLLKKQNTEKKGTFCQYLQNKKLSAVVSAFLKSNLNICEWVRVWDTHIHKQRPSVELEIEQVFVTQPQWQIRKR